MKAQETHTAWELRRGAWFLLFVALPFGVPPLLFYAFFAAMAEAGGKEPNFPVALLSIGLAFAAEAASMVALKCAYARAHWWTRLALVLALTLLAFPIWGVLSRIIWPRS